MTSGFISGPAKLFVRPDDPRKGNEWIPLGEAKEFKVADTMDTTEQNVEILVTQEAAVINHVVDVCGEMEAEKGFREDADHSAFLRALGPRLNLHREDITRLEEIAGRIDVLNNVTKLMLMVSELSEAMTELRKNGGEHYGEELADTVIRIFSNAQQNHIALGDEIIKKIDKNSNRPHKHGRNF